MVTLDTSIKTRFMLGSASEAAAKARRKRGFGKIERGQSFYVPAPAGPCSTARSNVPRTGESSWSALFPGRSVSPASRRRLRPTIR
jgi:hypothetical protein